MKTPEKTPEDVLIFAIKICEQLRREKFKNQEAILVSKLILVVLQGGLD